MADLAVKVILTGGRKGKTCTLGGYHFSKGVYWVQGTEVTVPKLTRYLGRVYKAFPENSKELADAQAADREREEVEQKGKKVDGANQISSDVGTGRGENPSSVSGVLPSGGGSPTTPSNDGSGAEGASSGSEGIRTGGDGLSNPGNDPAFGDPTSKLLSAVKKLDHLNDEHWTAEGLPKLDALIKLSGIPNLTRATVSAALPDCKRRT